MQSLPAANVDQHGSDREAHDVVAEYRRQTGNGKYQSAEQDRRRQTEVADPDRHPGVEAAETQLRDHHEREQQDDSRQMDRLRRLIEGELADGEQRDRAEQCDARSIQRQEWQAAQDHSQVHDAKDHDDADGHGRGSGSRLRGQQRGDVEDGYRRIVLELFRR